VGKLLYGESNIEIGFSDRILAHVQIVIGTKLRRKEGFFFSWKDSPDVGSGRSSIWVDAAVPLFFRFSGSRPVAINRDWIQALALSADSANGMMLSAEPGALSGALELPHSRV
jgi:hypothetical protein